MKRTILTAAIVVSVVLASGLAWAGRIHPELEGQLINLAPGGTLSVIVEMVDQADAMAAAAAAPSRARHVRLRTIVNSLRDLSDHTQASIRSHLAQELAQSRVRRFTPLWIMNGVAVTASEPVIRALAARSDVWEVRPDRPIPAPTPVPAPTGGPALAATQWNINQIRAPEAWALNVGYDGTGSVVGSFDTGVDGNHPDLASRYRGNHAISWFDPYNEHATPFDANGHGTHTTGTMVGGSASGNNIGVAPGAKWIAAKAWNDAGSATTSAFHQIFQWFLSPGGDPANAPDVVNQSWGFTTNTCVTDFLQDVRAFRAAGIFPAFAAGNAGSGAQTAQSPGNYAESFAVGATDSTDTVAAFSSRGPSPCDGAIKPDVSAPGVGVTSTYKNGGWASLSGTSMATPHVAGAVAVLRSINQGLTVDQLETALMSTAVDLGAAGADNNYGSGRIDLYQAAQKVSGGGTPALPDLVISAVSAPASANPGASITVTETTKNQGSGSAGASTTKLYLSTSSSLDATAVSLGSRSVAALAAGATSNGSTNVTVPSGTAAGSYFVIAQADGGGAVAESNDNNNTASVALTVQAAATAPDLIVSVLSAPSSAAPGATITVNETTKNQGNGSAGGSTTKFYLSKDAALDSADVLLGSRTIDPLAAGASVSGTTSVVVPSGTAAGSYFIIAKADADAAISESNESNNTASAAFTVEAAATTAPDLVVSLLSAPSSAAPGATISVSDTTKNQGNGSAGGSTTKFYLSNDSVLDSTDVLLGSRTIDPLAVGASVSGTTSLVVPTGTAAGSYFVIAKADADAAVSESNESNNVATSALSVQTAASGPADLVVATMMTQSFAFRGFSTFVSYGIKNQGAGNAAASTTSVFLSKTATLDSTAVLLGSQTTPALAAGASTQAMSMVTIPAGTPAGAYFIIVDANATGAVSEAQTSNNTSSRQVTIR